MSNELDYKLEFEKAVYNLLWVWLQYNSYKSKEGFLTHACMGAGENAAQFLQRHGYGKDIGYSFELNSKALEMFDKQDLEED